MYFFRRLFVPLPVFERVALMGRSDGLGMEQGGGGGGGMRLKMVPEVCQRCGDSPESTGGPVSGCATAIRPCGSATVHCFKSAHVHCHYGWQVPTVRCIPGKPPPPMILLTALVGALYEVWEWAYPASVRARFWRFEGRTRFHSGVCLGSLRRHSRGTDRAPNYARLLIFVLYTSSSGQGAKRALGHCGVPPCRGGCLFDVSQNVITA